MRIREEQIIHLGAALYVGRNNLTDANCEAQRHIDEAIQRGRELERAEMVRDTARLDWLDRACVHVYEPKQYFDGIGCGVCRVSHRPNEGRNLRAAIDAAREAQG